MDPKGTWLIAPSVRNSSCSHPRYPSGTSFLLGTGIGEVIQALFLLCLSVGVIGANLIVIFVINNRRYASYIHPQPRYLLTSLALNDLAIGLLVTPFGVVSALFQCWAWGEVVCQIQALLRGALSQQSAVILICMAIDRYVCVLYPRKYTRHSSKKGCVAILSITWIACLTIFGLIVLPKGYYYNPTGLMACEPFYSKPSYRILSTCAFYFPTTMVLMYCYGSSFHASRFRLFVPSTSAVVVRGTTTTTMAASSISSGTSNNNNGSGINNGHHSSASHKNNNNNNQVAAQNNNLKFLESTRRLTGSTSRTMSAMSLGFIVMVTPWTIQEVVAACTGSKVPPILDFFVTWTAMSNSFWNPFLYWLLNAHFRRITRELLGSSCLLGDKDAINQKSRCCSISSDFDPLSTNMPMPPAPPKSHPPPRSSDVERMSEKYWGEILERTLSSTSLQALQQSFSGQHLNHHHHSHHGRSRTPLAHHSNRFNHSPSLLTNQTSILSLNHISRDNGFDPFRSNLHPHHYNNHRHSYMSNGEARMDSKDMENDGSEEEDDGEEDEEEDERGNEDLEETSNSDSVQEEREGGGNGPRVSFISNSETRLNDFAVHDKNCAKAKPLNAQIQSVKGLPGM